LPGISSIQISRAYRLRGKDEQYGHGGRLSPATKEISDGLARDLCGPLLPCTRAVSSGPIDKDRLCTLSVLPRMLE
jgi:hypothetical protein